MDELPLGSRQGLLLEDQDIIWKVKAGDREAFSVLVEKYHRPLLNFIYHLLGPPSMVEDVGQEVFLSAYQSLGRFDPQRGTPFSAWLFTIARNRVYSELRKKRPLFPLEDFFHLPGKETSPEENLLKKERIEAIRECLKALPEKHQRALMDHLEGFTNTELARRGNIPTGTVKARLFRAKQILRGLLEKRFGGL
jgi:RNA polymerase sigma-70 factor (ECF subfamily)